MKSILIAIGTTLAGLGFLTLMGVSFLILAFWFLIYIVPVVALGVGLLMVFGIIYVILRETWR